MQSSPRVVIFGTDSIEVPTSGGEQRSYWLSRIYDRHGIPFKYCYSDRCMNHFRPAKRGPKAWRNRWQAVWRGVPLSLVRALGNRSAAATELHSLLPTYRRLIADAALVVFDHPFAFPFLESSLGERRVVYSSQNVEAQILGDYFRGMQPSATEKSRLDARIQRAESALTRRADLVIACTERDGDHYRREGAQRIVVAPNGATRLPSIDDVALAAVPFDRYVVFISSAWNPNVMGLLRYCEDLNLAPDRGLVCAGGIGHSTHPGMARLRANPSIAFTSLVSQERLAAIVSGASAIVMPMLDAGGSNVKTAEALLTQLPILASPAAFRGFERFLSSAGVTLCETPVEFQKAIAERLEHGPDRFERPETDALLWPTALEPAELALLDLLASPRSEVATGLRS